MTEPYAAPAPPRDRATRREHALELLVRERDLWVATCLAGPDTAAPQPYLVPLSFAWHAERIVLAVQPGGRTARGIEASGSARLGLGGTRDVVMLDVTRDAVIAPAEAPQAMREAFAEQTGWDVTDDADDYVFVVLTPTRIQAWRESGELRGRTLMVSGRWKP